MPAAIEDRPDWAVAAEQLLAELEPTHVFMRSARLPEVYGIIDDANATSGPVAALTFAIRVQTLFVVDRRAQRNLESRIRELLPQVASNELEDCATVTTVELFLSELLKRSELNRALRVLHHFRSEARAEELWSLYGSLSIIQARIQTRIADLDAALRGLSSALDDIPVSARTPRLEFVLESASLATGAQAFTWTINLIETLRQSLPHRNARLERVLTETHACAGRIELQRGNIENARPHYEYLLTQSVAEFALPAALIWGEALAARGDVVSLLPYYQALLHRVGVTPLVRRRLQGRIGLALFASGDPERALLQLREAFAESTVLDRLEPGPLDAYAELLATNGEKMLATWARNRAHTERKDAISALPRVLARD